MSGSFLLFFIVLFILAAFTREGFVVLLLYFLAGVYATSVWWSQYSLKLIQASRKFPARVFWGEQIAVTLSIQNSGLIPLLWLQAREALPLELHPTGQTNEVVSLSGKKQQSFVYKLDCRHRGYFALGPLDLFSGDFLGITPTKKRSIAPDRIIVFPKIIPLSSAPIPSLSPLGIIKHKQPIFEDPSRVRGKRAYVRGDSLRRVDWKATAITHQLQVKMYEPSIALSVMIFLNLNQDEYEPKLRSEMSELAITVAASLANWLVRSRQSIGLATNGHDILAEGSLPQVRLPRRGRGQLLILLETMARLQSTPSIPIVELIQRESIHLGWGTTIIAITNLPDENLLDGLLQARRRGLNPMLVLCGPVPGLRNHQLMAAKLKIPLYHLMNEKDLEIWQR